MPRFFIVLSSGAKVAGMMKGKKIAQREVFFFSDKIMCPCANTQEERKSIGHER